MTEFEPISIEWTEPSLKIFQPVVQLDTTLPISQEAVAERKKACRKIILNESILVDDIRIPQRIRQPGLLKRAIARIQMANVTPSSPNASQRLARVRQRGTKAELLLRKALHAKGVRYRLHVPLLSKPRRVADIVFPSARVVVFVDGCFWHGCPQRASWPKSNADFWREKIETNRSRDADTDRRLDALDWKVVRIWEHEDPADSANRIFELVRTRRMNETRRCRSQQTDT